MKYLLFVTGGSQHCSSFRTRLQRMEISRGRVEEAAWSCEHDNFLWRPWRSDDVWAGKIAEEEEHNPAGLSANPSPKGQKHVTDDSHVDDFFLFMFANYVTQVQTTIISFVALNDGSAARSSTNDPGNSHRCDGRREQRQNSLLFAGSTPTALCPPPCWSHHQTLSPVWSWD